MTVSQGSFKKLRYVVEGSFGAGAAAAKMQNLRFTSENFKQANDTREIPDVAAVRQIKGHKKASHIVEGTLDSWLYYGDSDAFMMAALLDSAWSSAAAVCAAAAVTITANTGTYAKDATTWSTTPTVGSWVYVSGSAGSGNNGWKKVATSSTTTFTVSNTSGMADKSSESLTINQAAEIVDGTTITSYAFEREYSDLASNQFVSFIGMVPNRMTITVEKGEIINISFDFIGKTENTEAATTGDGSATDVGTDDCFRTTSDLTFFLENMSPITDATTFTLTVDNGFTPRWVLDSTALSTFSPKHCRVTGSFNALYESSTQYDKVQDLTSTSFAVAVADTAGNKYLFEVIDALLLDGDRAGGGVEQDIEMSTSFVGRMDSTELHTIRICRIPAA